MIQYSLCCDKSHQFDAWFKNAAAFDEQRQMGMLKCPICGSDKIKKALMAPAVSTFKAQADRCEIPTQEETVAEASVGSEKMSVSAGHPDHKKLRDAIKTIYESLVAQSEYVGEKFAEEARKIHYKEAQARGIYGEASAEEAASLAEEGVEFMPLPRLPEDNH